MSPIDIMRDLIMLGAESTVKSVKGSGGGGGGAVQRGMAALRSMVGRG